MEKKKQGNNFKNICKAYGALASINRKLIKVYCCGRYKVFI